jgi:DEAD/DEAH box helicase domain-containing protein
LVFDTVQPAGDACYGELPAGLHPKVRAALHKMGRTRLYAHQAEAFRLAQAGRHVVVATPTASGKSLCYNLPVLQCLAEQPQACALYLFPTKALSRDQEQALHTVLGQADLAQPAITYDGDTPPDARRAAKQRGGLLLTNPDMLHGGILPHHASWARFLADLRYVVIDELHVYRGVFGSHLANVVRRLRRIARFHGANPQFIFASATIGNAAEHAGRILGESVACVGASGAPHGRRHVMIYNPPVTNHALNIRGSCIKAAVDLTLDLVRAEVPTLVFGQSRNSVEVMLKYLRDRVKSVHVDPESIQSYRGGYLPQTRRRIETGLRTGAVRCVVATSALELGIDIGALQAVVCAGYPGSVAALWQRFGRGGRRGDDSLAVLVASSAPMDQYFALQPSQLMGAPVEHARIDPDNVEILVQHLKCAAFELPFREGEAFGDLPPSAIADALGFLADHKVVHPVRSGQGTVYHWASNSYPAADVSLRQIGWDNVVIIDQQRDKTLAEMDWRSAHTMLHEQAIYQHVNVQYQVERLDLENRKAFVRQVAPDYYTDAHTHTKVTPLEETRIAASPWPNSQGVTATFGDISVVEKVVGFKKIKYHTHENAGYGEVNLPEMQMHTTAFWLTVASGAIDAIDGPRPEVLGGLRGVATALHTVAAIGLMVDKRDLGQTVDEGVGKHSGRHDPAYDPSVYLFDQVAGGVGLAERIYEERTNLLQRARGLIKACPCTVGCPGCTGPQGLPSRKKLALALLDLFGVGSAA